MEFTVVILGDKSVGKTTFINTIAYGNYSNYKKSVYLKLKFNTSVGEVKLNILESTKVIPADGYLLMFSITDMHSFDYARGLLSAIKTDDVIICGNKVDNNNIAVKRRNLHKDRNLQYFDISNRSLYQHDKPFLYLIRKLLKDNSVIIYEGV